VAPISAITFVWLASSGVHAIFDALELEVGVSRSWWRKRLMAIAACVALSVGVAVITLLGTGFSWVLRLAGRAVPGAEWSLAGRVVRVAVGALVAFGLVAGLYWAGLPRCTHSKRLPIMPGAFVAVVLEVVLVFAYGTYLARVGYGDAYQAGLAVVAVSLMVLYLFAVALLGGTVLNAMIADHRRAD
jgi:membrane protein